MDLVYRTAGSSWTELWGSHLDLPLVDTLIPVEKTSAEDQEEVVQGVVEVGRSRLGRIAVAALVVQCVGVGTGIAWERNVAEMVEATWVDCIHDEQMSLDRNHPEVAILAWILDYHMDRFSAHFVDNNQLVVGYHMLGMSIVFAVEGATMALDIGRQNSFEGSARRVK